MVILESDEKESRTTNEFPIQSEGVEVWMFEFQTRQSFFALKVKRRCCALEYHRNKGKSFSSFSANWMEDVLIVFPFFSRITWTCLNKIEKYLTTLVMEKVVNDIKKIMKGKCRNGL